ncbi:MAG: NAD(P)H-dependent oxidoreductase [Candidatus Saccharimonadales bacterium]
MKKILIINGHPNSGTLCSDIAGAYAEGARTSGAEVRTIHIRDLPLEKYLRYAYYERTPVSKEIQAVRDEISWAEHIVFVYPNWWSSFPGIMKLFIDIVFVAGFAFKYREGKATPEQLLKGRTASILLTMDIPPLIYKYVFGNIGVRQLKARVLRFNCGVKTTKVTYFGPVRSAHKVTRAAYVEKALRLGRSFS